jgi:hypothetical protein
MTRPASLLLAAFGFGLIAVGATRPWQAAAQQPIGADAPNAPMPVLSDTLEYCGVLERRILRESVQPADVQRLLVEGHRQCDHGEVRQGIANLRRALLILKHKGTVLVQP